MRRRGFTIAEVLVAAGVGLLVMAMGLAIFLKMSDAGRLGESWLSLQLNAREVDRRLLPLLRMATPPNSAREGIYLPEDANPAATVVFCVPEDLLAATPAPFDPRAPVYHLVQIRHDVPRQQLLLEDYYHPERVRVLGRNVTQFQVVRADRAGLTFTLEFRLVTRDARGLPKPLSYKLSDSVQLPE